MGYGIGDHFELGLSVSYLWNRLTRNLDGARGDLVEGDTEGDDGFSEAQLSLKYGTRASDHGPSGWASCPGPASASMTAATPMS